MDTRTSTHRVKQTKKNAYNRGYGILGRSTSTSSTKEKSVWAKIKAQALKEREGK